MKIALNKKSKHAYYDRDLPNYIWVENVTSRFKKVCYTCGQLPHFKRLKVMRKVGSYPRIKTYTKVYCQKCSEIWYKEMVDALREVVDKVKKMPQNISLKY